MILLLGYGISNKSIEKYLQKCGKDYIIYDDYENKTFVFYDDIDLIIKSGSFKNEHFIIKEAKKRNIKIISDLEYFYQMSNKNKEIIVVSASNGKSTTVSLIKHILGKSVDLGGNIGYPLFDFINSKKDIVIEASSYMNEYADEFKAKYYVINNIYSNHLEHHHSFNEYIKAKMRFLKNIEHNSFLIYNYDDLILRELVKNYDCYKIPYSKTLTKTGVYINKKDIYFNRHKIISLDEITLLGIHNLENILSSIALCFCYGENVERIRQGIITFKGIEHRLEKFMVKNNIEVYNDSKATNFVALKNALNSFSEKKILLVCGGEKKEDDYTIINDSLESIKEVVINGENKEELKEYFMSKNIQTITYNNLEEVVLDKEKMFNEDVDVILFSPGSPSFDQFKNFEERGKFFKENMQ